MRRHRPRPIHLGISESGERLYLKADERKTHMHVIGASGRGKSYFLEYLIRQDIRHGDGLCLIDPHGTLYHNIVAWCAKHASLVSWDKLVLLDASAPGWTFGFNPLNFGGGDTSYSVDSMVNACAQVWGGEDTASTPRLKKVLRGVFHALAEKDLSLAEADFLINERPDYLPLRKLLTEDINDPVLREHWARWNEYKPHEFREQFESTNNRLMEFMAAQAIRTIFGQTKTVINFGKVMDEGGMVLVNLEPRGVLSDDNARTLGTLITNDLFVKAKERPEGSRPFYFYVDECGRYLNESIQRMLDESRKRGLHCILANQHLSQLRAAGDIVYAAIMTDAQTKVVFGGLMAEDIETIVKEVFLDLHLEEAKRSLTRKVAVGQEKAIFRSGSTGQSSSRGRSSSQGTHSGYARSTSSGTSEIEGQTFYGDEVEGPTRTASGQSRGESDSASGGSSASWGVSDSEATSELSGWTEGLRTLYADAVGGVFSLDEQRYKKGSWLKKQPKQMALLARPDFSLVPFRVATVASPRLAGSTVKRFVENRFAALPFVGRYQDSLQEIEQRALELKQRAGMISAVVEEKGEFDPLDND